MTADHFIIHLIYILYTQVGIAREVNDALTHLLVIQFDGSPFPHHFIIMTGDD